MPIGAPTVCRSSGCGQAHSNRNGFCEKHKAQSAAFRHTRSTTERGYGATWQKVRKLALVRDHYLCRPCEANDWLTAATEVDHIVPKYLGGTDDIDNLQSICKACHRNKTLAEAAEARAN